MEVLKQETDGIAKPEKKHIGNAKLSAQKKAIKVHIFEINKFYVIPLQEVTKNLIGKVYEYTNNEPEIVGEITAPTNGKKFYVLSIKSNLYYIRDTYMQLLLSGSNLSLGLYEE